MKNNFLAQFKLHIARGEYEEALARLKNRHATDGLMNVEKRVLIRSFDSFLEGLESSGKEISEDNIQVLAEFKRYLIIYQLEKSDYDPEQLKELIKKTVMDSAPLADLVKKPFAFCVGDIQVSPEQALAAYREILTDANAETSRRILARQRLYYNEIPTNRFSILFPLTGFVNENFLRESRQNL